jgi:hypothetical protein
MLLVPHASSPVNAETRPESRVYFKASKFDGVKRQVYRFGR